MNYNEWRDELKNNLLSVSESERRRVLEYYAEAYADRREAGFSEREIIDGFGAPYDAAQRILFDGTAAPSSDPYPEERKNERRCETPPPPPRTEYRQENYTRNDNPPPPPPPPRTEYRQNDCPPPRQRDEGHPILFAVFCIIFAIPLFGIVMALVGISIGLCVAPFGVLISGVVAIGGGIGTMVGGELMSGLFTMGVGLIIFGVGVILIALFTRFVKLLWWLWCKAFNFVKSLFVGRARA